MPTLNWMRCKPLKKRQQNAEQNEPGRSCLISLQNLLARLMGELGSCNLSRMTSRTLLRRRIGKARAIRRNLEPKSIRASTDQCQIGFSPNKSFGPLSTARAENSLLAPLTQHPLQNICGQLELA